MTDIAWAFTYLFAVIGFTFVGSMVVMKPNHKRYNGFTKVLLFLVSPLYLVVYFIGVVLGKIPKRLKYFCVFALNVFIVVFVCSYMGDDILGELCKAYLACTSIIIFFASIFTVMVLIEPNEDVLKVLKTFWKCFSLWPIILLCLFGFVLYRFIGWLSDDKA